MLEAFLSLHPALQCVLAIGAMYLVYNMIGMVFIIAFFFSLFLIPLSPFLFLGWLLGGVLPFFVFIISIPILIFLAVSWIGKWSIRFTYKKKDED